MSDEERKYQEFLEKTMKASKEFIDDYNNLSPYNKLKFQNDLKNQATFDVIVSILKFLQN